MPTCQAKVEPATEPEVATEPTRVRKAKTKCRNLREECLNETENELKRTTYFNYQSLSFSEKEFYEANQNKNGIIVKHHNESLTHLKNSRVKE